LTRRRISTDSRSGSPAKISATTDRNGSAFAGRPMPRRSRSRRVDVGDVRFTVDPTHGPDADADELCHVPLVVSRLSQNLYRVPREHVDHPFPRC
jgi:hypothetical protein